MSWIYSVSVGVSCLSSWCLVESGSLHWINSITSGNNGGSIVNVALPLVYELPKGKKSWYTFVFLLRLTHNRSLIYVCEWHHTFSPVSFIFLHVYSLWNCLKEENLHILENIINANFSVSKNMSENLEQQKLKDKTFT